MRNSARVFNMLLSSFEWLAVFACLVIWLVDSFEVVVEVVVVDCCCCFFSARLKDTIQR